MHTARLPQRLGWLTGVVAGAQQPGVHGGALPLGGDASQVVERGGAAAHGAQRFEHRGVGQDADGHLWGVSGWVGGVNLGSLAQQCITVL